MLKLLEGNELMKGESDTELRDNLEMIFLLGLLVVFFLSCWKAMPNCLIKNNGYLDWNI